MKTDAQIIHDIRGVIFKEIEALQRLPELVDQDFADCVKLIYESAGRVVVTGIGKSANIGRKIVATLNSTGTPALFMHAADAIHGDLGMVTPDDIVICISRSGNTPEIKVLAPLIKSLGNNLIAMVSDKNSFLAKKANHIIHCYAEKEACPNNLAPTSSTTVQLVMGDALAVALLEYRNFSARDFAKYHPGGTLGKKLYLTVGELSQRNQKPEVSPDSNLKDVIIEISSKRLGNAAVVDNGRLIGVITDGDLRRMLQKTTQIEGVTAKDIMSPNPKTIDFATLVVDALEMMRDNNITQLLVLKDNAYDGVIHLHDILKEGII
ncbi:MAG: KpsF/GutQ family sugar-phosphate isomerase [Bacteroidales bacterium]|nr:KpsF/GutQ family sugar-phosphate isomerase [Bacteroidales bacterium]